MPVIFVVVVDVFCYCHFANFDIIYLQGLPLLNLKKKNVGGSPVVMKKETNPEPEPILQEDRYDFSDVKVINEGQKVKETSDDQEVKVADEGHMYINEHDKQTDFEHCLSYSGVTDLAAGDPNFNDEMNEIMNFDESLKHFDDDVIKIDPNDKVEFTVKSEVKGQGLESPENKNLASGNDSDGVLGGSKKKSEKKAVKFADLEPEEFDNYKDDDYDDDEFDEYGDDAGLDQMVSVTFDHEYY